MAYVQFALRYVILMSHQSTQSLIARNIYLQDALRKKQTPPVMSTPVSASSPVNSSTQTISPAAVISVASLINQSTPTHVDHNTAQPTVLLHNLQSSADKEVSLNMKISVLALSR